MKRITIFFLSLLLAVGCASTSKRTIVMNYSDFGPQAAAWEYIGMKWWQWESHGGSNPGTKYDIKVIVYRSIPLAEVQKIYPVNQEKKQDYRYLEYAKALEYLDKTIEENLVPEVTEVLKKTRNVIVAELGN